MAKKSYEEKSIVKQLRADNALLKKRCDSLEQDIERKKINIECLEQGARPHKDRVLVLSKKSEELALAMKNLIEENRKLAAENEELKAGLQTIREKVAEKLYEQETQKPPAPEADPVDQI